MKSKKIIHRINLIYGIIVTLFLLVIFGPKVLSSTHSVKDLTDPMLDWNDDPTAFFLLYVLGYALTWWLRLPGAILILLACGLFFAFNPGNQYFTSIFLVPACLVSALNALTWYLDYRDIEPS